MAAPCSQFLVRSCLHKSGHFETCRNIIRMFSILAATVKKAQQVNSRVREITISEEIAGNCKKLAKKFELGKGREM